MATPRSEDRSSAPTASASSASATSTASRSPARCGFAAALLVCLAVVFANYLPPAWIALAFAIALSNTVLELWSPRGTDDFTMATGNALRCLAFGMWRT